MQLLVSDSDVKSYKQIKDDLDGLRLLVEKSGEILNFFLLVLR